jgi:hypothetical protein
MKITELWLAKTMNELGFGLWSEGIVQTLADRINAQYEKDMTDHERNRFVDDGLEFAKIVRKDHENKHS